MLAGVYAGVPPSATQQLEALAAQLQSGVLGVCGLLQSAACGCVRSVYALGSVAGGQETASAFSPSAVAHRVGGAGSSSIGGGGGRYAAVRQQEPLGSDDDPEDEETGIVKKSPLAIDLKSSPRHPSTVQYV